MTATNSRPRALLIEVGGAVVALALALIAVGAVVGGARAELLFYDGDSVLFELVHRSIAEGLPFHWAMSAVLFFFPEIPVYLGLRAIAATGQQAILLNAILNLVVLYALVRIIAALVSSRRIHGLVAGMVGYGAVILCLLSETTGSKETLELTTLFLIGTYYYGSILAAFASVALVVFLVRRSLAGSHLRSRGSVIAAAALVVLAVASTMSNPLYVLWGAVPLAGALLVTALFTRVGWGTAIWLVGLLAAGSVLGIVARIPLAPFVSPSALSYVYPGRQVESFFFYLARIADLRFTPFAGELVLFLLLSAAAVAAVVVAFRTRANPVLLLVAAFGLITPLLVFAFNVALGTESVRYLQPLYFAPVLSVVVLVAVLLGRETSRVPVTAQRAAAAVVAAAVVIAVVPAVGSVASAAGSRYDRVGCLEQWVDGRDLTGTGMFWDIRAMKAYGDESVSIVQTDFGLIDAFPWLVDVADFYDADVSYVIVAAGEDGWQQTVIDTVGAPAGVVDCATYRIMDYVGTPGEARLSALLSESGRADAIARGFLEG